MSTRAPLLSFKDGKFSVLDHEPAFLRDAAAISSEFGIEDWEEILSRAGVERADTFKGVTGSFQFATIDVYTFKAENQPRTYYAEVWDQLTPIWRAVFSVEDLPDFYSRYVFPLISTATLLSIQAQLEPIRENPGGRTDDAA